MGQTQAKPKPIPADLPSETLSSARTTAVRKLSNATIPPVKASSTATPSPLTSSATSTTSSSTTTSNQLELRSSKPRTALESSTAEGITSTLSIVMAQSASDLFGDNIDTNNNINNNNNGDNEQPAGMPLFLPDLKRSTPYVTGDIDAAINDDDDDSNNNNNNNNNNINININNKGNAHTAVASDEILAKLDQSSNQSSNQSSSTKATSTSIASVTPSKSAASASFFASLFAADDVVLPEAKKIAVVGGDSDLFGAKSDSRAVFTSSKSDSLFGDDSAADNNFFDVLTQKAVAASPSTPLQIASVAASRAHAGVASSPQVAASPIAASAAPLVAVATPRNNVPDQPEVDEDAAFAQRMVAEAAAVEAKRAAEAAARDAAAAAKADDALAALRSESVPAVAVAPSPKPAAARADLLADLFGDGRPAAVTPTKAAAGTMNALFGPADNGDDLFGNVVPKKSSINTSALFEDDAPLTASSNSTSSTGLFDSFVKVDGDVQKDGSAVDKAGAEKAAAEKAAAEKAAAEKAAADKAAADKAAADKAAADKAAADKAAADKAADKAAAEKAAAEKAAADKAAAEKAAAEKAAAEKSAADKAAADKAAADKAAAEKAAAEKAAAEKAAAEKAAAEKAAAEKAAAEKAAADKAAAEKAATEKAAAEKVATEKAAAEKAAAEKAAAEKAAAEKAAAEKAAAEKAAAEKAAAEKAAAEKAAAEKAAAEKAAAEKAAAEKAAAEKAAAEKAAAEKAAAEKAAAEKAAAEKAAAEKAAAEKAAAEKAAAEKAAAEKAAAEKAVAEKAAVEKAAAEKAAAEKATAEKAAAEKAAAEKAVAEKAAVEKAAAEKAAAEKAAAEKAAAEKAAAEKAAAEKAAAEKAAAEKAAAEKAAAEKAAAEKAAAEKAAAEKAAAEKAAADKAAADKAAADKAAAEKAAADKAAVDAAAAKAVAAVGTPSKAKASLFDDLFGDEAPKSPAAKAAASASLFGNDDSNDDLFGSMLVGVSKAKSPTMPAALFEDDEPADSTSMFDSFVKIESDGATVAKKAADEAAANKAADVAAAAAKKAADEAAAKKAADEKKAADAAAAVAKKAAEDAAAAQKAADAVAAKKAADAAAAAEEATKRAAAEAAAAKKAAADAAARKAAEDKAKADETAAKLAAAKLAADEAEALERRARLAAEEAEAAAREVERMMEETALRATAREREAAAQAAQAAAEAAARPAPSGPAKLHPPLSGTMTVSKAVQWLQEDYDDFNELDLSNDYTMTNQKVETIAEALRGNRNLRILRLRGDSLTSAAARALAGTLRVNHTLRTLDLEDNKIDNDGIEAIASALAENRGLVELTLFKNREPGERALSVLIQSLEFNTTLRKINWRLTSRQSFAVTKKLTRNVEILRRKENGLDYADIDPNLRRERDESLVAAGGAAFGSASDDQSTENIVPLTRSGSIVESAVAATAPVAAVRVAPVPVPRASPVPIARVDSTALFQPAKTVPPSPTRSSMSASEFDPFLDEPVRVAAPPNDDDDLFGGPAVVSAPLSHSDSPQMTDSWVDLDSTAGGDDGVVVPSSDAARLANPALVARARAPAARRAAARRSVVIKDGRAAREEWKGPELVDDAAASGSRDDNSTVETAAPAAAPTPVARPLPTPVAGAGAGAPSGPRAPPAGGVALGPGFDPRAALGSLRKTNRDASTPSAPAATVPAAAPAADAATAAAAPGEERKTSASRASFRPTSTPKCQVCDKTVYLTEQMVLDEKVFHKTCVRCKECNKVLSLKNLATMQGVFWCKPHFLSLFKEKGNYDGGFGQEQHKMKWVQGAGGGAAGLPPKSFVPVNSEDNEFTSAVTKVNTRPQQSAAAAPGAVSALLADEAGGESVDDVVDTLPVPARPATSASSALLDDLADIEASLQEATAAPLRRPDSAPISESPVLQRARSSPNIARRFADAEARGIVVNPALLNKSKSSFNPLADVPREKAASRASSRGKSANDGADFLLEWVQMQTRNFAGVKVTGFTAQSWSDGLAFCALAAARAPHLVKFDDVVPLTPVERLRVAYTAFTSLGVNPLLDAEDLASEKLSNMTYLSEIFKTLRR